MTKPVYIYALCEPDTQEVCYIGQTLDVKSRLSAHIQESKTGSTKKCQWLRTLIANNKLPAIKVLSVVSPEMADNAEKDAINCALRDGARLVNTAMAYGENAKSVVLQPIHLGEGANGLSRKMALEKKAAEAGFFWGGKPSIGRWLISLADAE